MAISLETLAAIADYPWSDIAKAAKVAMVTSALGGNSLTIGGRTIGRITTQQATDLYQFAADQVAAEQAGENGMGNVLVNFTK